MLWIRGWSDQNQDIISCEKCMNCRYVIGKQMCKIDEIAFFGKLIYDGIQKNDLHKNYNADRIIHKSFCKYVKCLLFFDE